VSGEVHGTLRVQAAKAVFLAVPLGVVGAAGLVYAVAAALEDVPDLIGAQVRILRQAATPAAPGSRDERGLVVKVDLHARLQS
jgi:hypothetical protein